MVRAKIGPGASVTQATSKSTAVTCDALCGVITMNNAALAASTSVGFTVNNALIDADDTVNLVMASGGTAASYVFVVDTVAAGSFKIHLRNISGGSLGEAVVLNFTVLKNFF
jgi:hypothetical protein